VLLSRGARDVWGRLNSARFRPWQQIPEHSRVCYAVYSEGYADVRRLHCEHDGHSMKEVGSCCSKTESNRLFK
jgi:hypothetical protein